MRGYSNRVKPTTLILNLILYLVVLGALFTSSLGSAVPVKISAIKGFGVQLSNVDDWNFGVFSSTHTASSDLSIDTADGNWDDMCVFSSTGAYNLDVSSQNGGPLFLMTSGTDQIPYQLVITFKRKRGERTRTFTNSPINLKNLKASQQPDCSDGVDSHNLKIAPLVTTADFNAAPTGAYQDIVTLIVSPK